MKKFGIPKNAAPPVREEFEFEFDRDGEVVIHKFRTAAKINAAALASALAQSAHPERAMGAMMRMLAKMLDNKDGVPAGWKIEPLPPMALPLPEDAPEGTQPEMRSPGFRGPDGAIYSNPAELAPFLEFERGSSRRRWLYLMNEDDELTVEMEQLREVFEWLISLAAGRPTGPSS